VCVGGGGGGDDDENDELEEVLDMGVGAHLLSHLAAGAFEADLSSLTKKIRGNATPQQ
jgi:hypothetical protein